VLAGFILFSVISFLSPKVQAKSFYFPSVDIQIQIQKDGTFQVEEDRTFRFEGSFTQVYWDIPLAAEQKLTVLSFGEKKDAGLIPYVALDSTDASRPAGYFAVVNTGGMAHIEAYHSSTDQDKTFQLVYTLGGGIQSYQDVAEFYWKVIGSAWGARTDKVQVTVTLPEEVGKNNIYVWGHGPLSGQATIIDGRTTHFTVTNVPANTFVEIREAFPSSVLMLPPHSGNRLDTIRKEEQGFQNKTRLTQGAKIVFLLFVFIATLGWATYWFYAWKRYGDEYKVENVPKRLPFPPSKLQPALVEALVNQEQSVSPNSFAATVLSLAQKRYLKIEVREVLNKGVFGIGAGVEYDHIIHFQETSGHEPLLRSEKMVLSYLQQLSDDGDELSFKEMQENMKLFSQITYDFYKRWQKQVLQEADSLNFIEDSSKKLRGRFTVSAILIALLIQIGQIVVFQLEPALLINFGIWTMVGVGFGAYFVSKVLLRWSKTANVEAAKWTETHTNHCPDTKVNQ
jgi:uncharacterized membrane protein